MGRLPGERGEGRNEQVRDAKKERERGGQLEKRDE